MSPAGTIVPGELTSVILYYIHSKNGLNVKPSKGGLLGFASGVAALVAMKTQSEDFPIFMI